MKKTLEIIGRLVFWAAWPLWFVYFKFNPNRTRVLVVSGSQVLLVKGFLGAGKWALPGGGTKKGEDMPETAVRELQEETGITVPVSALRSLGDYTHSQYGLRYRAHYFILELDDQPATRKRLPEIIDIKWFEMVDIRGRMLDDDAAYALKKYMPLNQTSLL